jgi:hypothetical protein
MAVIQSMAREWQVRRSQRMAQLRIAQRPVPATAVIESLDLSASR